MGNRNESNLLKIEERERNRGRGFRIRMKETWDDIYENSKMSAQRLAEKTKYCRNTLATLTKFGL